MSRQLHLLAAFLVQPHPQPAVLRIDIANLHARRSSDPGKGLGHESDQGVIAFAD